MPSYAFLLVLALAASTVTPVLSVEAPEPPRKTEGRASSHLEPVERGLRSTWSELSTKEKVEFGSIVGVKVAVLAAVLYGVSRLSSAAASAKHNSNNVDPTNTTQATPTPTSADDTEQTSISRRGLGEHPLGHRSNVDIFTREYLDNNDLVRRTYPHLDLLSRADLGEALSIFSRMLDRLD